jgi:hypothetical protein
MNNIPSPSLPTCNFPPLNFNVPNPDVNGLIAALLALLPQLPGIPTIPLSSFPCPFTS